MAAYRKTNNKGVIYEYVDSIPETTKPITFYSTRSTYFVFDEDRYFYQDKENIYEKVDENKFKKLYINKKANGCNFVNVFDKNKNRVSVYLNKLTSTI